MHDDIMVIGKTNERTHQGYCGHVHLLQHHGHLIDHHHQQFPPLSAPPSIAMMALPLPPPSTTISHPSNQLIIHHHQAFPPHKPTSRSSPNISNQQNLSVDTLRVCIHLPLSEAAVHLDRSESWLKSKCREWGIARWPYRRLSALRSQLIRAQYRNHTDQVLRLKREIQTQEDAFICAYIRAEHAQYGHYQSTSLPHTTPSSLLHVPPAYAIHTKQSDVQPQDGHVVLLSSSHIEKSNNVLPSLSPTCHRASSYHHPSLAMSTTCPQPPVTTTTSSRTCSPRSILSSIQKPHKMQHGSTSTITKYSISLSQRPLRFVPSASRSQSLVRMIGDDNLVCDRDDDDDINVRANPSDKMDHRTMIPSLLTECKDISDRITNVSRAKPMHTRPGFPAADTAAPPTIPSSSVSDHRASRVNLPLRNQQQSKKMNLNFILN